jgi:endonuclease/exonuclease/phosphatase family metal-dependent hydrolase
VRVLTFNIHGWRTLDGAPNLDAVGDVIAAAGADIVGLNEVFLPGDIPSPLESLSARLHMHYVFGACARWPAQDDMPAKAFGNAVLSRWPIIASAAHHLTPVAGKEDRGLLEARVLLPGGRTFTVYVTHLDHTDEEARAVQFRGARTWLVRDRNRPHILMGDFNAVSAWDYAGRAEAWARLAAHPMTAHMAGGQDGPRVVAQVEKAGYTDLYTRFNAPGERSFLLPDDVTFRIDYIFASAPLVPHVTGCALWTQHDGVSDHRPVYADLDF